MEVGPKMCWRRAEAPPGAETGERSSPTYSPQVTPGRRGTHGRVRRRYLLNYGQKKGPTPT